MIGTTLGHFKIGELLGEGGMGAVYRAKDSRLGREVAIKVLPEEFTADPERLARFEREAQVVARLNHSSICSLYDVGGEQDRRYLVMELVEGETLDVKIRGGLEVGEAVGIARQIAEALEAAHAQGIVHRDLKPANVMVTPDGRVKVLDFGLAKAREGTVGASPELSHSPTLTAQMTQAGVILGTAAYMSPEQARGGETDARADIWSWGVILFEMLTSEQLFDEPTVSDTLAAVLRADFDWAKIPKETPRSVRTVLRRSLERDRKNRLHAIADARIELDDETHETGEMAAVENAPPTRGSSWKSMLFPWVVALLAIALAIWTWTAPQPDEARQRLVAKIPPPPEANFLIHSGLAVAPDGMAVVFGARGEDGVDQLWLHSLKDGEAHPLPGTEKGQRPFWSPDGKGIGFFGDSELKVLWIEGGIVETLADTSGRSGGSWNQDDTILVSRRGGFLLVSARGGTIEEISSDSDGDMELLGPTFLPDGLHFIYLARDYSSSSEKNELRVASLAGGPPKALLASNSSAIYSPSGELMWWQGGHIRAQAFDLERLELVGETRLVQPAVQFDPPSGLGMFSVSAHGTMVYRSGSIVGSDELALVDREGQTLRTIGAPGNYYVPRFSPDGTRVAVDRSDETNRGDIWIYDVERGTGTRLTTAPADESNPVWSPDGSRLLLYSSRLNAAGAIHLRSARVGDEEELLWEQASGYSSPADWSDTGLVLGWYAGREGFENDDLGAFSLADGEITPIASTRFSEFQGSFSPDASLVAYCSNETGRYEVYVQSFPDPVHRIRVSTDGGCSPKWRSDGREIYFVRNASEVFAVPIRIGAKGAAPEIGPPEKLFANDFKAAGWRHYDTIDGQTFLVNRRVNELESSPLTLVLNAVATAP